MRVDDAGLQVWAAHCQTVAGQLAGGVVPATGGPAGQRTAAAAQAADAGVDATVGALKARAHTTGGKVNSAAARYAGTDQNSAQRIAAVAVPPVV